MGGTVFLYRSRDLVDWAYRGQLFTGCARQTGLFWEMPQFIDFGVKQVLIVNEWPGSKRGWYWVSTFANERFDAEKSPVLVDLGEHYLSPSVARDQAGRVLAFGVIKETRSSGEQLKAGWANLMGLPRVFSLHPGGGLAQAPVPELAKLRGKRVHLEQLDVRAELECFVRGEMLELAVEFTPQSTGVFGLRLFCSEDNEEETLLYYDADAGRVQVNKEKASKNPRVEAGVQGGPFQLEPGESLRMRVFIDHSVVEAFINDRATLTTRVYATRPDSCGVALYGRGGSARVSALDVWTLNPARAEFMPSTAIVPGGANLGGC